MFSKQASGVEIPVIGFGTYKLKGEEAEKPVLDALKIGYRHIDTAEYYENEEYVGKAIKKSSVPREEIFLVSKVWKTNLSFKDAKQACLNSLNKLNTDYLDLLLIHWPNPDIPLEETLDAFNDLKDDGYVENIGVSNFDVDLLRQAIEYSDNPIITNQVEYNPYKNQNDILEYCIENDILLTAYSPLAKGKVMENNVLNEIGEKKEKTPVQITLRWLIEQKNVIAIPKASEKQHRRENFDIFDFSLTEKEMKKMKKIKK
ncbi:aldo/keto reductase [Methanonatronarchaeum sp. AMET6-2]|uniref:aldo/keto reductase n=1 Tax=Methanonatronarchaeum sp. AMET6-2 TaxID=2933293 RepID=UPI001FF37107|nr:aldo/keto reductase [Methanonatronarchaeum sp. AMET6-2]UOY09495.1 aldo/keto reductase [Methanonatronarchaeum sp. AMET6-2]